MIEEIKRIYRVVERKPYYIHRTGKALVKLKRSF
jgi:hypothetical protein